MAIRVASGSSGVRRAEKPKGKLNGLHLIVGLLTFTVFALVVALIFSVTGKPSATAPADSWGPEEWRAARTPRVVSEVAKGLGQTDSTVSEARGHYRGWPTGWGNTLAEAVAQSGTIIAFTESPDFLDYDLADLQYKIRGRQPGSEEQYVEALAGAGIDKNGYLLDDDGNRVEDRRIISAAYPRYGAYRIADVMFDEDHSIAQVEVVWWLPIVRGYKSASTGEENFGVSWETRTIHLHWNSEKGMFESLLEIEGTNLPQPATEKTNLSFDERAAFLGPGWYVPADATEEKLPDAYGAEDAS